MARSYVRPNGAFKLLVMLQYMTPPTLRMSGGFIDVPSVRKLGRVLGVESKKLNRWLVWLEMQGYITHLSHSEDRRAVRLRLRQPPNTPPTFLPQNPLEGPE